MGRGIVEKQRERAPSISQGPLKWLHHCGIRHVGQPHISQSKKGMRQAHWDLHFSHRPALNWMDT